MAVEFQQRQKELCLLSVYIEEHEKWLQNLLSKFGWSQEALMSKPKLVQCPLNCHHFVPSSALDRHKMKCQYAALGVQVKPEDLTGDVDLYKGYAVPSVEITPAIEKAIEKYAASEDFNQSEGAPVSHERQVIQQDVSNLEDSETPQNLLPKDPIQIIRYIKSWRLVPGNFVAIELSAVEAEMVKKWLYEHLPSSHAFSGSYGGEIQAVDGIMQCLIPSPGAPIPVTPNSILGQLQPVLKQSSRQFVLQLWQHLHTSRLQREHGLPDSSLQDLRPLYLTAGTTRSGGARVSEKINALVERESGESSALVLPMDHMLYKLSPRQRRVMYDYVVEVGGQPLGDSVSVNDPDLYRDDQAKLKAKLKAEQQKLQKLQYEQATTRQQPQPPPATASTEGKSFLQLLKQQRDHRRRRQKYRAKNVRINRRATHEVFRDIIHNRMEEIRAEMADTELDEDLEPGQLSSLAEDTTSKTETDDHRSKNQYSSTSSAYKSTDTSKGSSEAVSGTSTVHGRSRSRSPHLRRRHGDDRDGRFSERRESREERRSQRPRSPHKRGDGGGSESLSKSGRKSGSKERPEEGRSKSSEKHHHRKHKKKSGSQSPTHAKKKSKKHKHKSGH